MYLAASTVQVKILYTNTRTSNIHRVGNNLLQHFAILLFLLLLLSHWPVPRSLIKTVLAEGDQLFDSDENRAI